MKFLRCVLSANDHHLFSWVNLSCPFQRKSAKKANANAQNFAETAVGIRSKATRATWTWGKRRKAEKTDESILKVVRVYQSKSHWLWPVTAADSKREGAHALPHQRWTSSLIQAHVNLLAWLHSNKPHQSVILFLQPSQRLLVKSRWILIFST